jgi:hypothetical protein
MDLGLPQPLTEMSKGLYFFLTLETADFFFKRSQCLLASSMDLSREIYALSSLRATGHWMEESVQL